MNREELERKILELWMQTRIPITRAHLQYITGKPRKQLESALDQLVTEGAIEMEMGSEEVEYSVPGAKRPTSGPKTVAELGKKKAGKRASKDASADDRIAEEALVLAKGAGRAIGGALEKSEEEGKKSLKVAAGVGLLGPFGWLYAGSFKEAIPAAAAFAGALWLLPSFMLSYLAAIGIPASVAISMIYAWQYNREGHRRTLFSKDKQDEAEESASKKPAGDLEAFFKKD